MVCASMSFTPMLLVEDVERASRWLCKVLPLTSAHGGPDFEMLQDPRGQVLLWLHAANGRHDHPQLADMQLGALTGGSIYYLQVEDVEEVHRRATAAGALILEPPHNNPLAGFTEFTFEDPNGYRFAAHGARLGGGYASA